MDCNPYLALAASLACGYIGMKSKSKPRDAVNGEAYSLPHSLPFGLHEALELFEAETDIRKTLGAEFCVRVVCFRKTALSVVLERTATG